MPAYRTAVAAASKAGGADAARRRSRARFQLGHRRADRDALSRRDGRRSDQGRGARPRRSRAAHPNCTRCSARRKRGIVLDLKKPEAIEIARALARRSRRAGREFRDRRHGPARPRRGRAAARSIRELIYVSASGLGRTGPEARAVAYGTLLQCYAGFAGLNRHPEIAAARRLGLARSDVRADAGLRHRRRAVAAGAAPAAVARIDFSMLEAMLWTMAEPLLAAQLGAPPQPHGNRSPRYVAAWRLSLRRRRTTGSAIAVTEDGRLAALCAVVPALASLAGLEPAERRASGTEAIDAALAAWARPQPAAAAAAELTARRHAGRRARRPRAIWSTARICARAVSGRRTATAFCRACRGGRVSGGQPARPRASAPTPTLCCAKCSPCRRRRLPRCGSRGRSADRRRPARRRSRDLVSDVDRPGGDVRPADLRLGRQDAARGDCAAGDCRMHANPAWVGVYYGLSAAASLVAQMGCGSFIIRYGALRMSQVALVLLGGGMAAAAQAGLFGFAASAIIGGGGAAVSTPTSSQLLGKRVPAAAGAAGIFDETDCGARRRADLRLSWVRRWLLRSDGAARCCRLRSLASCAPSCCSRCGAGSTTIGCRRGAFGCRIFAPRSFRCCRLGELRAAVLRLFRLQRHPIGLHRLFRHLSGRARLRAGGGRFPVFAWWSRSRCRAGSCGAGSAVSRSRRAW